ncbi:hypothetical protein [Acinetobacter indicus]|uniref:hypothetical protein n=1 Tax=Acinetobacter indicus TaxID=756892 RepID=UPI000CEC3E70|nr:hypothetical protein [Acinetobacter indicus]
MVLNLRKFFEKSFFIFFIFLFILDFITGANTGSMFPRYFYQIGFICFLVFLTLFMIVKFNNFFLYSSVSILFLIFFCFNVFLDLFWLNDYSYDKILKNSYLLLWFLLISFGAYLGQTEDALMLNKSFYVFLYFSFFVSLYGFFYYKTQFDIDLSASIYSSLVFFPLLLLQKDNLLKRVSIIFLIVLVIISFKRGAILCLLLSIFACWCLSLFSQLNKIKIFKNILLFIFLTGFLSLLIYLVNFYFDGRLSNRFSTEELVDGSGRGYSNNSAIEYIININDPLVFMFGSKDYILPDFLGHNDWLVYFINNGLVTCLLILIIYVVMVLKIIKIVILKDKLMYSYTSIFVISVLMSLYSTSFGPTFHPMLMMLTLGILETRYKRLTKQ